MLRTMVYARCGDTHGVVVHGATSPGDEEWQLYLREMVRWGVGAIGVLIFTAGGAPSSSQRRALRDQLVAHKGTVVRSAVVSDSLLVRGSVNAISLFYPNIRSFRPDAMDAALTHIGGLLHRDDLLATLATLRRRLEIGDR